MASGDRFYLMELSHRPAFYGDIGSILKVEGLIVGGEGGQSVLMLPNSHFTTLKQNILELTTEEWSDFLIRSDNPEILIMPAKAFHRKVRYEISGAVQQKIWAADGFKCVFCGAHMGITQLTIDHWVPLELGGKNDTSNYLSVCRKENKDKGSMDPKDWCELKGIDYNFFVNYLTTRRV